MPSSMDRIERKIWLKASPARVWRALADTDEFGRWFCVDFRGQTFAVGQVLVGKVTAPGYEHVAFDIRIERMEAERLLAWRWHPAAVEAGHDYTLEPTTLVEFSLQAADGGTQLTVVESGFDKIPASRRQEAFRLNNGGWDEQVRNIETYVAEH